MDYSRLSNISEIKNFLEGSKKVVVKFETTPDKYDFINRVVKKFKYKKLSKKEKHVLVLFVKKLTGYKKAQTQRLIKKADKDELKYVKYTRHNPNRIYTALDIKLLEKTDELHHRLNSIATKEIFRREYEVFGNEDYANISKISAAHINNLRKSNAYTTTWKNGTKPTEVQIGKTKRPEHNNMPGSIRVDTVHQRDIYHINAVDEITQWEVVVSVPQISSNFLEPVLCDLLVEFPFVVFNFHSDKGSEFINQVIAKLLNKLLIHQTKSRSRHCNDNALIESKNGSIVRKNLGYFHVDQSLSDKFNEFNLKCLTPYINYHKPCLYLTDTVTNSKGRSRNVYGQITTPYEKLKEVWNEHTKRGLPNFLKEKVTFEILDSVAYKYSDNEFARILRKKQEKLLRTNKN